MQAKTDVPAVSSSRLSKKKAMQAAAKKRATVKLASVDVSVSAAKSRAAKALAARQAPGDKMQTPYRLKTGAKSK